MLVELIVHSKAEMIEALQRLGTEQEPPATTICLWRRSGLTWFRFPAAYGQHYSYTKYDNFRGAHVEVRRERTSEEAVEWRRRKVRLMLAAVRRISEREFVA